jgi:hypothetical protein
MARAAQITSAEAAPSGPDRSRPLTVQLPGLWKAMILTSFLLNIILIFVVLLLIGFLLSWRAQIGATALSARGFAADNITELRDVVQQLQAAHIRTSIPLDQKLDLRGKGVFVPVNQETEVVLTQPVPLSLEGADIDLGAGNRLRAQNIALTLPAGTPLRIALKMNIPLDEVTIPVQLQVPVDIAMKDTELAPQFRRLGNVLDRLLAPVAPLLGLDIPRPDPPLLPPTATPTP